jgi:phosphopantothenoylcysteine synthetase/decarboxylase
MKVLITSGGTKIRIDRVRDITNMSSGTFGSKIAKEFLKLGHEVVFIKAKYSKSPVSINIDLTRGYDVGQFSSWYNETVKLMERYSEHEYTTYEHYSEMLKFLIGVEQPDLILLAAAVSDYGVENYFDGKIRSNDLFTIKLTQLPKVINHMRDWAKPSAKLVGFKMLVDSKPHELLAAANRSLTENNLDMVVANDLQDIKDNNHKIKLVSKNGVVNYDTDPTDQNFLAKMVVSHSLLL